MSPQPIAAYGVAVAMVAAATLVRWLLDPLLDVHVPYITFFLAVVAAAWYGGLWPALLATALGALAAWVLFVPPRFSFTFESTADVIGLVVFLIVGAAISALGGAMRAAQRRSADAEQAAREQAERLRTTLASIGDGVITTDVDGRVTGLNSVAESLTGWTATTAVGKPLTEVFTIVNESTRVAVENPAIRALRDGAIVGLANHTVLIAKDGAERPIDDSAAPIRCMEGELVGCVLVFRDVTERRQLERDRQEAQERAATSLESITDGFMRYDRDWRIVYVNSEAERINQLPRSEMLGKTAWELFPAVVGTKLEFEFRRAVAEKVSVEFENHYEPWNRWYSIKCYPTPDGGLTTFIREITQRKEHEEEIERLAAESERQRRLYETVLSNTPDLAYVFDLNHRFTYANDALLKMWGRTWEEAVGKNCLELGYERWHAAMHDREIDQVVATKQSIRGEVSFTGTSGERLYDYIFVPVIGVDGEVEAVAGTTRDITEGKRAERQLREAEVQFRTLAENITQLAWMARSDGHIYWYNRRWYEYTGTSPETQEGWGWESVHDPHVLPAVRERWKQSLDTGEPFDMTFPLKGADGIFRQFLTRVVPVKDPQGRVVQWFGTNTDVTEQREMANQLREQAAELSEAGRRKDEFLATLSHELRNPLAPIRNGLQILRLAGGDADAVEQALTMMDRQFEQMVRLVDDLMDVSRISQGKLELRLERVPLAAVINSAVETSRPLIDEMEHELTVSLPEHPIMLNADLTRLAQVVLNLLNNAAKYSERGGRIWLAVERQGSDVVISVRDGGVGIAAEQLPRIFELFSQVDRSLDKTQGGLGIGLTLVRRLVEMHGGRIEARSEGPGKGAEFIVRLPVVVEASVPATARSDSEKVASRAALRILVVDDNRDGAASLSMMLKFMGNDTRIEYDGEQAVRAAAEFQPDVILLDIGLPKLNGYEACRLIREQPGGERIIIVAQTGWGQDEDRQRTLDAGFDHHLVKPIDTAVLVKLLAEMADVAAR